MVENNKNMVFIYFCFLVGFKGLKWEKKDEPVPWANQDNNNNELPKLIPQNDLIIKVSSFKNLLHLKYSFQLFPPNRLS